MINEAPSRLTPERERKYSAAACPCCGAGDLRLFYQALDMPVHNSLIVATKAEALEFPRGDVVLGSCRECGFITNVAFDASKMAYTTAYEDQQIFSATFSAFQSGLVEHLVARFALHDKDVLEIGCGKGDFLALLCERGSNRGVGIDPTAIQERIVGPAAGRVRFIQDYYSERYADCHADIICCRHTLEHIEDTSEFLRTIRRSIGDRHETIVFFEVPDVLRVLREQAYWDIYYEHCSYFSPGSLARLFRASGFDVMDLSLGFDDQYILLEAKPSTSASRELVALEESAEQMRQEVENFANIVSGRLRQWKCHLHEASAQGKRIVVWGSGSKAVAFLTTVGVADEVEYVVDINPHRHGKFILGAGKEVVPPVFLQRYQPDEVIVMNPIYVPEIKSMLATMGVATKVVTV